MGDSTPMSEGECRRTRRGVLYCRIPEGVRFCPEGTTNAEECRRRIRISGDRRRGRWARKRISPRPGAGVMEF